MGASTDILPFNMKFTSCIFVAALLVAAVHAEDEHTDEEKYGSGLEEDRGFWPPIEEGAFYQANNHLGLPDDEFVQQMGCVVDCTGADAKVCDAAKAKFASGNLADSVVAACGDKALVPALWPWAPSLRATMATFPRHRSTSSRRLCWMPIPPTSARSPRPPRPPRLPLPTRFLRKLSSRRTGLMPRPPRRIPRCRLSPTSVRSKQTALHRLVKVEVE